MLPEAKILRLELLGTLSRPRDIAVVRKLAARLPRTVELITHPEYVSPDHYDGALRDCTAIIIPHRGRVPYAGYAEYGGRTKISGSENDQIRAGKPALVDARYRGMECLAACQHAYRSGRELAGLLTDLMPPSPLSACSLPPEIQLDGHRAQWTTFLNQVTRRRD